MKCTIPALLGVLLLAAPTVVQAQSGSGDNFDYTINPDDTNTITITRYTGTNAVVIIPTNINNLLVTGIQNGGDGESISAFPWDTISITVPDSVTSIGSNAFLGCSLTNVIIGNGVTNIGEDAFFFCLSLAAITVDAQNEFYCSVNGVLFDKSQTTLIQFPTGLGGSYTIPGSVTCIGVDAFDSCHSLTNVTIGNSVASIGVNAFASCFSLTGISIPASVTYIGEFAFYACFSLTSVYFDGNTPSVGSSVFNDDDTVTTYYLPGTTGWSLTFWGYPSSGPPAVLWNPFIQTGDGSFGVRSNQFGFNITGTTNIPIVVEACTNLASPVWTPLQTVTLTNGLFYFSDPQWTNYSGRFYSIQMP
jgi:hypothetical protein